MALTGYGREFGFHSERDWMSLRVLSRGVACFDFSKSCLAAGWKSDCRAAKMKQEAFVLRQGYSVLTSCDSCWSERCCLSTVPAQELRSLRLAHLLLEDSDPSPFPPMILLFSLHVYFSWGLYLERGSQPGGITCIKILRKMLAFPDWL